MSADEGRARFAPRRFAACAAFDWSGARGVWQRGIAGAWAEAGQVTRIDPVQAPATPHLPAPRPLWSRSGVEAWLTDLAASHADVLVGIDISAGLPFVDADGYFPGWTESPDDARSLWALVDAAAAADPHLGAHDFVTGEAARYFRRPGNLGDRYGKQRSGRLRLTEVASRDQGLANPYSTLNLVGAAQVGLASLSAMRMFHRLRGVVPVWPFDPLPASGPVIIEIYAALAGLAGGLPRGRTKVRDRARLSGVLERLGHHHPGVPGTIDDHAADALMTAAWLAGVAGDARLWRPRGMSARVAATEGWTFGVA